CTHRGIVGCPKEGLDIGRWSDTGIGGKVSVSRLLAVQLRLYRGRSVKVSKLRGSRSRVPLVRARINRASALKIKRRTSTYLHGCGNICSAPYRVKGRSTTSAVIPP